MAKARELAPATRHLTEVIEHLRLVGRDLRPMMLSDLGLTESLRSFTTKVSSLQRRVVARFPTPIPRLDDETEIAVYRVAQEALGNALRHADARSIELLLRSDDGRLVLEVRDDAVELRDRCRRDAARRSLLEIAVDVAV